MRYRLAGEEPLRPRGRAITCANLRQASIQLAREHRAVYVPEHHRRPERPRTFTAGLNRLNRSRARAQGQRWSRARSLACCTNRSTTEPWPGWLGTASRANPCWRASVANWFRNAVLPAHRGPVSNASSAATLPTETTSFNVRRQSRSASSRPTNDGGRCPHRGCTADHPFEPP